MSGGGWIGSESRIAWGAKGATRRSRTRTTRSGREKKHRERRDDAGPQAASREVRTRLGRLRLVHDLRNLPAAARLPLRLPRRTDVHRSAARAARVPVRRLSLHAGAASARSRQARVAEPGRLEEAVRG